MRSALTLLSLLLLAVPGCGTERDVPQGDPTGPLRIHAVNYPLAWMAEQLAGEAAIVEFPAPADADPAYWRPSEAVISGYQQADLILLNGAGYAKWTTYTTLPRRKTVDTSAAFASEYIQVRGVSHSHGPEGDHSHAGTAYTTWLDLEQMVQQGAAIAAAIAEARPEQKASVSAAFERLRKELMALDARLRELGARKPHLLASHPLYQYFARRYGFDIDSLHWEPGVMPPESEWDALAARVAKKPAKYLLWEKHPADVQVKRLEPLHIESIAFLPCANRPREGDFLSVMQANVERLARALGDN